MLTVFYEDKDIIVVKKPVGMVAQSTHSFCTGSGQRYTEAYRQVINSRV